MAANPQSFSLSPEDYLALERQSDVRSEYIQGQVTMMAGASREHNNIVVNFTRELSLHLLEKPCEVFSNDMRVHIPEALTYTYPDVVVVCGEPIFADSQHDHLMNPLVIIEVLSPSTESKDRGKKFDASRRIPSLKEYILVSQDEPLVERYTRQEKDLWLLQVSRGLDAILLIAAIDCTLPLQRLYLKVAFPAQTSSE